MANYWIGVSPGRRHDCRWVDSLQQRASLRQDSVQNSWFPAIREMSTWVLENTLWTVHHDIHYSYGLSGAPGELLSTSVSVGITVRSPSKPGSFIVLLHDSKAVKQIPCLTELFPVSPIAAWLGLSLLRTIL